MNENIYSNISDLYSHLMRFIDYKKWANYIYKISKEIKDKNIFSLELASGNCALANYLVDKFYFYVVSDLSSNMLVKASAKIKNKVSCNFLALPFKKKFNFVFSCFDSVNYLTNKKEFLKMLDEVANILDENGIFTFDASMENNSLKYQKYLNRKGDYKGIKYEQISRYSLKNRIHKNKFIIDFGNGVIKEETHYQKIYRFEDYFEMISHSKFSVLKCYEAFSFTNANANSERIQFVLKKRN
ncbi:methyltransferase domain-containing protein [Stygiobacter electus]|uniref:Methyltransferase domain-containing protein n=1 Tax=Stygiobacter electus TaxID=3032292 RepID=A0AAE3NYE7_9BACT|nr:methyltransferase domain-containing protein [Stygiobacter electus]MDF1612381.1 methyltransferase domain-containing protein [Stygiobacter electus]